MKTLLAVLTLASTLSAHAYVMDCEQNTKLTCQVTYYARNAAGSLSKEVVTHSSNYELMNWDEPSLSYCEASVGFNDNNLYIEAALTEASKDLQVRMMRSSVGGKVEDQFSTTSTYTQGQTVKASFSLATELNSTDVYAVEVSCKAL